MRHKHIVGMMLAILMVSSIFIPVVSAAGTSTEINLSATLKDPKPEIGVELSTNVIDFGVLRPGETSEPQGITITNTGLWDVDITVTVEDDGDEALFVPGLLINDDSWDAYTVLLLASKSDDAQMALHVPENYASRGAIGGTAIFWVEGREPPETGLLSSTYLGGTGMDMLTNHGGKVAVADDGSIYVVGDTRSADLPVTDGAFRPDFVVGSTDIVIAKYSSDMSTLLACTYFSGTGTQMTGSDSANAVIIGDDGSVFVTGSTTSDELATSEAYQTTRGGGADIFIAKFDPTLSTLMVCTYFGNTGGEMAFGMAFGSENSIYITGRTTSDGMATSGSAQGERAGTEAFVARFNYALTELKSCTYFGGSGSDEGATVATASDGSVYVVGMTASSGLAISGAYQESIGGGNDAFIAKYDPTLSTLLACTYLGGSGYDQARSILIGGDDEDIYVSGRADSSGLASTGAYQTTLGGDNDAFLARFDASLSDLLACTYLGSGGDDSGYDIVTDGGLIYLVANVDSADLPTTADAFSSVSSGSSDTYLACFDLDLSSLIYGSYFGGTGSDNGRTLVIAPGGNLIMAGTATSEDLPTKDAVDDSYNGGSNDIFLTVWRL